MANIPTPLEQGLSKLKKFDGKDWNVFHINNGSDFRWPTQGEIGKWNYEILPNIRKICNDATKISPYLSEESDEALAFKLHEIVDILEEMDLVNAQHSIDNSLLFSSDLNLLSTKTQSLANQKFLLNEKYTLKEDKDIKVVGEIVSELGNSDLESILSPLSSLVNQETKNLALQKLIEFYNSIIKSRPNFDLLFDLTDLIIREKNIILKNQKNEALIEVEAAKNQYSIVEFKKKADSFKIFIFLLNGFIVFWFLTIILLVFYNYFNQDSDLKGIFHTFAVVLAISGFLAFLIKEKNILSSQHNNYMKCHTELVALSTYIVGIDEAKAEDLKVHLAHKYFTGYENNSNNTDPQFSNENFNQVISLLKEIQKK